jgi:cytochrome c oxidase subunit IV
MVYGIQMLLQVSFRYVIIIPPLLILLYKVQYVIFSNLEINKNY